MYRFVGGASFATLPRIRHEPGSAGDKQHAKPNEPTDVKAKNNKGRMEVPRTTQEEEYSLRLVSEHKDNLPASAGLESHGPFSLTTTRPHTMSRLAYYPTPPTRRLGSFTLDACPPTSPTLSHSFMIPQTAKRWSGSLGFWGVGAGTALVFVQAPQLLIVHRSC
jgi:hypothetical protein